MKERSTLTFCVRLLLMLCLLLLLGCLYWSALLQEERLQDVEEKVDVIRSDIEREEEQKAERAAAHEPHPRPYIDPRLPNLLVEDPYFTKILPKELGPDFHAHGTLRMAIVGMPDNLHPYSPWEEVADWMTYCQGAVGSPKSGFYEVFSPDLAIKLEKRTSREGYEFWVHLRENLMWQPLEARFFPQEFTIAPHFLKAHPVTSHDFQFYWDAVNNPNLDLPSAVALRGLLQDIVDIEVVDDLTFIVRARTYDNTDRLPYALPMDIANLRPLACWLYQYLPDGSKICRDDSAPHFYRSSSAWAQIFSDHFASRVIPSCGPWVFDGLNERQIRFRKNKDYFRQDAALYEAVEIYFLDTLDAIWRDFEDKKIDLCTLAPQNLPTYNQFISSPVYRSGSDHIRRLDYLERAFHYIAWNEKNPIFASQTVRRALTLAIDLKRLIHETLYGQGVEITGPFAFGSAEYDREIVPYPYDREKAKLLLAEDGWYDPEGTGVLQKTIDGKITPLAFSLTYYVRNEIAKANCELVSMFLKEIGVACRLQGLEIQDLSLVVEEKSFDALFLAWAISTPPEDPYQLWDSEGANERGSSNIVCFANKEVDALIQKLYVEAQPEERRRLYHRLDEILYEQLPYTFLFSMKLSLVWWDWIENIFIPSQRQDLIPGACVNEPAIMTSWRAPP